MARKLCPNAEIVKIGKIMNLDDIFRKEVGYDINTVITKLNEIGLTSKDLDDITNYFKDYISQEIEIRNIPHDYRFLLLSLVLFKLFKRSIYFQKRLNNDDNSGVHMVLDIKDIKEDIEFRKEI